MISKYLNFSHHFPHHQPKFHLTRHYYHHAQTSPTIQRKEKQKSRPYKRYKSGLPILTVVVDVKQSLPRYARVIKMLSRTGSRGGVQQVRVEFMEDTERTMVRNVRVCASAVI